MSEANAEENEPFRGSRSAIFYRRGVLAFFFFSLAAPCGEAG